MCTPMVSFFLGYPCPQVDKTISTLGTDPSQAWNGPWIVGPCGPCTVSTPSSPWTAGTRPPRRSRVFFPAVPVSFSSPREPVSCLDPRRRHVPVFPDGSSTAIGGTRAIRPLPAIFSRRTTLAGAHQAPRFDPHVAKETHR